MASSVRPIQDRRLPDFLIIGAQKSGTTSLQWALSRHPDVHCIDETHFFCCNRGPPRDLEWYASQLADGRRHKRVLGEKCPHYIAYPGALKRIAETLPEARLVTVLRDPVSRTYAHYWQERRIEREALPFPDALAAEGERRKAGLTPFDYVERSRYLPQLQRVCEYFPRERLCVLLMEELVARPAPVLASVCEFLGVPPFEGDLELARKNPHREVRSKRLRNIMMRWSLVRRLPGRASDLVGRAMTRVREYPALDPDLERELRLRFEPDNHALAQWLGRDLDAWRAKTG